MQLSTVSNSYKSRSRKLKEQERRKRFCYIAVLITVALIIGGVAVYAIFGDKEDEESKEESKDDPQTPVKSSEALQLDYLGFLQQD